MDRAEQLQRLHSERDDVESELRNASRRHTDSAKRIARLRAERQRLRRRGDAARRLLRVRQWIKRHRLTEVVLIVGPFAAFVFGSVLGYAFIGGVPAAVLAAVISLTVGLGAVLVLLYRPDSDRLSTVDQESTRAMAPLLQTLEAETIEASKIADSLRSLKARMQELDQAHAELRHLESRQHQSQQIFSENWKGMRGAEFEDYLARVFTHLGYRVDRTGNSGDQGVDLVVHASGQKIAIQAKGYVSSVGNAAVQQAFAGMMFYGCDQCAVITNSRFTASAKELAVSTRCLLIGEDQMRDLVFGSIFHAGQHG